MSRLEELMRELCPDGVEYCEMGKVCRLVTGATPSRTNPAFWENGTIPWMSSGEVNNKRVFETESKISQLGYDRTSTTIVPIHTVVIALAGQGKTRGKVAITEIELCTNQSLCSIICGPTLNYKFLYYYLDAKYEELRAISNGDGTRGGLSLKLLAPYMIPIPPLPVQREIVRILDNFSERTAELTEQLTAELTARRKQYEYYRDKLLTFDVLGGGASDCIWRTLGEVCYLKAGKAISAYEISSEKTAVYSVPCFGGNGLRGYVRVANQQGDKPLIGRQGALCGNVCYATDDYYATEHAVVVTDKGYFNSRFLYHVLVQKDLNQYKTAGAQPGLSVAKLKTISVPVPDISIQNKLVRILDDFDALCNDLTSGLPAEIAARQKQYEYYRDKLLTFKELTA